MENNYITWLHNVTTEGYKAGVMIDRCQEQLMEKYYKEALTPVEAIERSRKVLVRVDAINKTYNHEYLLGVGGEFNATNREVGI